MSKLRVRPAPVGQTARSRLANEGLAAAQVGLRLRQITHENEDRSKLLIAVELVSPRAWRIRLAHLSRIDRKRLPRAAGGEVLHAEQLL